MYNESMAMIKQSDGSIYGTLLFVPTKINAVVDVYLKKEYKEGVDWVWEKGTNRIKWVKGSSIPYFTDDDLAGKGAPNYPNWSSDGRSLMGNCLYCVSAFLFEKQIAVSYTYDTKQVASQNIQYTSYQGDKLPKTVSKLKNNKDLKVLFFGDSIFSGCDASGMYNREPYMPYMHKLIEAELQNHTKGNVQVDNISVGGWAVQHGLTAINGGDTETNIADYSKRYQGYDLLILSFGMNDANTSKDKFKADTKAIVDKIRAANPNMEVILVSCMNPNPRIGWDVNQKLQGGWIKEIAAESKYSGYTAVVDFYAVHKSILQYKTFASTTGNNINHPNDWLIRVYAQNILATMLK
ncbi:MAG: SGNH/GDSL hydrolase family protein [Clostridiales bacterium]|nr:SGNH/GDSL hydrolase family protein [Clostridiales bacterium]